MTRDLNAMFRVGTSYGMLYVEAYAYALLDGDHLEFTAPDGSVIALVSARNWYLVTQVDRSAVPPESEVVHVL